MVLGHIAGAYISGGLYEEHGILLNTIHKVIYLFHMPLFMMISGFVYYNAYYSSDGVPNRKKLNRQVMNLIAVYVIFCVAVGTFKVLCGNLANNLLTFKDIFMLWALPIDIYWYLYVLIGEYLLFSISKFMAADRRILLAFTGALCVLSKFITFEYFQIGPIMFYSFFFCIGALYCRDKSEILGNIKAVTVLFTASAALSVLTWNYEGSLTKFLPIKALCAIGIAAMIWYAFEHISVLSKCAWLKYIGKHSMEIYVIHYVFTSGNRIILQKLGITNVYLNITLNFIVSTAIPILFSVLCKKLNIHGLFFKPVTYIVNHQDKDK